MAREVLLAGGAATLVAVIAVVGAVSVSHAVARSDSSGVPAGGVVIVPAGVAADGTYVSDMLDAGSRTLVVPAPAPLDIASSHPPAGVLDRALEVVPTQVPVGPTLSVDPGNSENRTVPQTPAQAGPPSGHVSPKSSSGFEKEQSRLFPDRD